MRATLLSTGTALSLGWLILAGNATAWAGQLAELTAPDPYTLVRRAVDLELAAPEFPEDFIFDQRVVRSTLNKTGERRETHVTDSEVMVVLGRPVARVVARDGQALTEKEAAREQAQFDEAFAKASRWSAAQRAARIRDAERAERDQRAFLKHVPDTYDFTLTGQELVRGRTAWVIEGHPRPGADLPGLGPTRTFFKLHGRIWIDVETGEWVRVDTEVRETLSWGWVLARIQPGSRIRLERMKLGEVWVPVERGGQFRARFFGFTKFALEEWTNYANFRRFRSESRIQDVREMNGGPGR